MYGNWNGWGGQCCWKIRDHKPGFRSLRNKKKRSKRNGQWYYRITSSCVGSNNLGLTEISNDRCIWEKKIKSQTIFASKSYTGTA